METHIQMNDCRDRLFKENVATPVMFKKLISASKIDVHVLLAEVRVLEASEGWLLLLLQRVNCMSFEPQHRPFGCLIPTIHPPV
jgi:hypothetical protein